MNIEERNCWKSGSSFDFYKYFCYNNYRRNEKGEFLMTLEVLKALVVILEFCMSQDSCKNCPMAQFCGKMPCEW